MRFRSPRVSVREVRSHSPFGAEGGGEGLNPWHGSFSFFFFFNLFLSLFIAVLGLHFCARAFSNCGKWGPLFIAVRGPLTIVASLVAEHKLQMRRLSNCGSQA